jgi:hypothetical protein
MLRLLVDTSVWLDLARRRDGQKWIALSPGSLRRGYVELVVPALIFP